MTPSEWVYRIVDNSRHMGKEAFVAAWAIELVTKRKARALCCWCLERVEIALPVEKPLPEAFRLGVHAGVCSMCDVEGHDVLVVVER